MKNIKVSTALLSLLMITAFFTCEKVPDYCGSGEMYDPSCAFCFGSMPYRLCKDGKYNPLVRGCVPSTDLIGSRCSDGSVVPLGTPCGGYTLTLAVTPKGGGNVDTTIIKPYFAAGDTATLLADPAAGYDFIGWAGALTSTDKVGKYKMNGSNPQVTIVAMFKPTGAGKLITDAFPEGAGEVTRNPNKDTYGDGETVTVTATGKPGYVFDGWSGASTSKDNTVTISIDESKTLVAIFTPTVHRLRATVDPADGGAVFVNKTAMSDGESHEVRTNIEVWAKPEAGYKFLRWSSGSGATFTDVNAQYTTVTLGSDANPTITAHFTPGSGSVTPPTGGNGDSHCTSAETCKQVTIGTQVWMAENLNIPTVSGSWCYENSQDSCVKYGRLYDWETARAVCPRGWHLPTRDEWGTLAIYAGGTGDYGLYGTAGTMLKSYMGWNAYSEVPTGTDYYGFSALPGGYRYTGDRFLNVGKNGFWWTVEDVSIDRAYVRNMFYDNEYLYEYLDNKEYGFSVRCIADEGTPPSDSTNSEVNTGVKVTFRTAGTGGTLKATVDGNPIASGDVVNPIASGDRVRAVIFMAIPEEGYSRVRWWLNGLELELGIDTYNFSLAIRPEMMTIDVVVQFVE